MMLLALSQHNQLAQADCVKKATLAKKVLSLDFLASDGVDPTDPLPPNLHSNGRPRSTRFKRQQGVVGQNIIPHWIKNSKTVFF